MGITCQSPVSSSTRCRHERLPCSFTQMSPPSSNGHWCLRPRDPLSALQTDPTQPHREGPGDGRRETWVFTLTNSSFSHSELNWATSSVSGFLTMVLQTSQMVRLAMNIPISGTNTLMPLPASAPFKLRGEGDGRRLSHICMAKHLTPYSNLLSDLKSRMFVLPSSYQTALY